MNPAISTDLGFGALDLSPLPPDLAERLSTESGCYSLAFELTGGASVQQSMRLVDVAGARGRLRSQAETARRVGNYMRQRAQFDGAERAIAEDHAQAVAELIAATQALEAAQLARPAAWRQVLSMRAKGEALQAEHDQAMAGPLARVKLADAAFEAAMAGSDDDAQDSCAEDLHQAELARNQAHAALSGLRLRIEAHEDAELDAETALAEADQVLAQAIEARANAARRLALVELDRAMHGAAVAWVRHALALRDCPTAAVPSDFDSLMLWFSDRRRAVAAPSGHGKPHEGSLLMGDLHLRRLLADLEPPSLAAFLDDAGDAAASDLHQ